MNQKRPWKEIARPEQLRRDGEDAFVVRGKRGIGRTRAGAEDLLERVRSGDCLYVLAIAPTSREIRHIMFEGSSGILVNALPGEVDKYNPMQSLIRFKNGVIVRGISAEGPDRLRGLVHGHVWADNYERIPDSVMYTALDTLRESARVTKCLTSGEDGL